MKDRAEYLNAAGEIQAAAESIAKTSAVIVTDLLKEIERLKGFEALYAESCATLAKLADQKPTAYFNPAATSMVDAFRFPGSHVDARYSEALYASPRHITTPKEPLQ